jgi:hypothetical protein
LIDTRSAAGVDPGAFDAVPAEGPVLAPGAPVHAAKATIAADMMAAAILVDVFAPGAGVVVEGLIFPPPWALMGPVRATFPTVRSKKVSVGDGREGVGQSHAAGSAGSPLLAVRGAKG